MRKKMIDMKDYDFEFVKYALYPYPHIPLSRKIIL